MNKEKELSNIIVKNIRMLCVDRNIGIGTFERAIGVSRGYLSRLEVRNAVMAITPLVAAARLFGMSIDELCSATLLDEIKRKRTEKAIAECYKKIENLEEEIRNLKSQIGE